MKTKDNYEIWVNDEHGMIIADPSRMAELVPSHTLDAFYIDSIYTLWKNKDISEELYNKFNEMINSKDSEIVNMTRLLIDTKIRVIGKNQYMQWSL